MICALCERDVPATTTHHLVPKQVGRRRGRRVADLPTVELCPDCHRQLHALFTNRELADGLASVTTLREDERVARFLRWVRRQDPATRARVRR